MFIIYTIFGVFVLLLVFKETRGHVSPSKLSSSVYDLKENQFKIKVKKGIYLSGLILKHKQKKALVIISHGYSRPGGKSSMIRHAEFLYKAGYDVALFDNRGFGDSTGKNITFGKTESEDLLEIYKHIKKDKEYKKIPTILYGLSMGGSTVLITAGKYSIGDAVISSVPFKSIYSLIVNQSKKRSIPVCISKPWIKLALILFFGHDYNLYTAEENIGRIDKPILLIGAKRDEEINVSDFNDLYNLNKSNIRLIMLDSRHDVWKDAKEEYKKEILRFVNNL